MSEGDGKRLLARGVDQLFKQRESFIIIGLTGWTGSGCSTAAELLERKFSELPLPAVNIPLKSNNDRRKSIVTEWAREKWGEFTRINVGSIIFSEICILDENSLRQILRENQITEHHEIIKLSNSIKSQLHKYSDTLNEPYKYDGKQIKEAYDFYFDELAHAAKIFREKICTYSSRAKYTVLMQAVGDNIRRSGKANHNTPDPESIFHIPYKVNKLIKLARRVERSGIHEYFVIDAIRNPFEASFFKERYSAFYLIAITTIEDHRFSRLHHLNYSEEEIKRISEKERPGNYIEKYDHLISQNIAKCLEMSDIILENPQSHHNGKPYHLAESLVKYVSLIQHPGLVPPDSVERCMQIAVTAKLNSGCISRQVGAAVTDASYSVKAVGWNSVPEGQVPCLFRNVKRIADQSDASAFSDFERQQTDTKFRDGFNALPHFEVDGLSKSGRPLSYCFKSTYTKSHKDKNQVHTRAIHAEENAFLQIAKYGGPATKGGILFSTASPCELCSKKAYQIGISRIYYIDPYPGIADAHILRCGDQRPTLSLFTGAIGRAYMHMYQPILPMKDELEVLMCDVGSGNASDGDKVDTTVSRCACHPIDAGAASAQAQPAQERAGAQEQLAVDSNNETS